MARVRAVQCERSPRRMRQGPSATILCGHLTLRDRGVIDVTPSGRIVRHRLHAAMAFEQRLHTSRTGAMMR